MTLREMADVSQGIYSSNGFPPYRSTGSSIRDQLDSLDDQVMRSKIPLINFSDSSLSVEARP